MLRLDSIVKSDLLSVVDFGLRRGWLSIFLTCVVEAMHFGVVNFAWKREIEEWVNP